MWTKKFSFSAVWVAGCLFVVTLSSLGVMRAKPAENAVDIYYFSMHFLYNISIAAVFSVFAVIHLLIDGVLKINFPRVLGWAQFGLMLLGAALICAPALFLRLDGAPSRRVGHSAQLTLWNFFSMVGYFMTLASVVLFVVVIVGIIFRHIMRRR